MLKCVASLVLFITVNSFVAEAQTAPIIIETAQTSLVYSVKKNGRLYQAYLGEKLQDAKEYAALPDSRNEAFIGGGMDDQFEPAIQVQHADKNPSLELVYQSHEAKQ